jgi:thiol-disulfide isomerase/thioredoxin
MRALFLPLVLVGCVTGPTIPTVTAATPAVAPPGIAFIEDDYPRALALAKSAGKPLFIDAWAPWCHTCLSMRSYVFTDERLRPMADRFVWLAVDTEKPESAPFLEHYPMQSWPTLWVVDAKTEHPALKWLGSATAPELAALLGDALGGAEAGTADAEAAAALLRGERASAAGNHDEAITQLRAALASAPPKWEKRGRADEALVSELWSDKRDADCAALADVEMAKIPPGTSLANVGLLGLECARRSPAGSAPRMLAPRLQKAVEAIALDPSVPMLDDDRSGLFEEVVDDRNEDGDKAGAESLATSWAKMLDQKAAVATSPQARAVFDAHRVLAYVALGDPARALPMLMQSEAELPADYNPPARIARVDLQLHRYDDGLAAIGRALSKGYGPRKLKLYLLEADLLKAKGDAAGEKQVLGEAKAFAQTLPANELSANTVKDIDKRLAAPAP